MKVSIITPTYNHEKYIEDCIKSVLKQTYEDWEMIIIDDASTDNTVKIAEKYEKEDSRIKLIAHEENYGPYRLYETYNEAFNKSKGQFIAILEGDDFWPDYKLEVQVSEFENSDAVLSYGNYSIVAPNGKVIDNVQIKKLFKDYKLLSNDPVGSILYIFAELKNPIPAQTVMVRRTVLRKINGFKGASYLPLVDYPTWCFLALEGKFKYINKNLGFWRRHITSTSFNKQIKIIDGDYKFFLDFIKQNKIEDEYLNITHKKYNEMKNKFRKTKEYTIACYFFLIGDYNSSREYFYKAIKNNPPLYKVASIIGILSSYLKIDLLNYAKKLK